MDLCYYSNIDIHSAKEMIDCKFTCLFSPRVPSHGEVALECASTQYGCALLYKARAMNDPLDDVPKSA